MGAARDAGATRRPQFLQLVQVLKDGLRYVEIPILINRDLIATVVPLHGHAEWSMVVVAGEDEPLGIKMPVERLAELLGAESSR